MEKNLTYRGVKYTPDNTVTDHDCYRKTLKLNFRGVTYFKQFLWTNGQRFPINAEKQIFPGTRWQK